MRFFDTGKEFQVELVERVQESIMLIGPTQYISKPSFPSYPFTSSMLTFSDFPLTPTNVPRRVYSVCDADNETERRE